MGSNGRPADKLTPSGLLDQRKQEILRIVCTEHIARAEPVGSERLASQFDFGVRSATIRNEMAEMTELGYLRQPHTSAGRIPSDRGYRFYVDRLMSAQPLSPREHRIIRKLQQRIHEQVDEILREACRVVAELTLYTSVATPPIASASRLESIRLLLLDARRILLVLVMESGRVEHVVIDAIEAEAARANAEELQMALNRVFAGKTCGELTEPPGFETYPPAARRLLDQIARSVMDGLRPHQYDELVVQGEVNALREPEFKDLKRLDGLLDLLHSRKSIYNMLATVGSQQPLAVIIGSESGYDQASDCSFVAARYSIGPNFAGAIGVFGPTRMRYSQAVPVVQTVARQVSAVLTNLIGGNSGDGSTAFY